MILKRLTCSIMFSLLFVALAPCVHCEGDKSHALRLQFDRPAAEWTEALPVGNAHWAE